MTVRNTNVTHSTRYLTSWSYQPPVGSVSLTSWVNSMNGEDDPLWKQRLKAGADVTHSMTASRVTVRELGVGRGEIQFYRTVGSDTKVESVETHLGMTPGTLAIPNDPGQSATTADNLALAQILRSVRAQTTQFGAGVFLGELRESLRMLRSPARAFRQGLDRYLLDVQRRSNRILQQPWRGRRQTANNLNEMIAGTYLEHAFGWQPLINDSRDIAVTLARQLGASIPCTRVRGHGMNEIVELVSQLNQANYSLFFRLAIRTHGVVRVVYRAGYANELTSGPKVSSAEKLRDLCGLNFSDVVPTIWNLLPWSFVADYFGNVGDMLDAVCTSQSRLTWKNKTTIRTNLRSYRASVDHPKTAQVLGSTYIRSTGEHIGKSVIEKRTVTRIKLTALPVMPTFDFQLPSLSQSWNLAALFAARQDLRTSMSRL